MLEPLISSLPATAAVTKTLGKGEYLFRQFDLTHSIYFMQAGRIQLQRTLESGTTIVVHQALPGESFAEASLFSEQYHCDAVCISDTILIQISKLNVLDRMKNDPDFSITVLEVMSKQVQHYRQRFQIASMKSAEERILAALSANLPYEHVTELAASIGLTHEASYRTLSQLVKKKLVIKLGRGRYVLK